MGSEMCIRDRVLHSVAGLTEQSFAVTGLPDEKKGERIVVLHTLEEQPLEQVIAGLAGEEIPNLWKPRKDQFFKVEELPYLGSGKLDLKGIKNTASEFTKGSPD